jgi:MFS family permease
MAEGGRPLAPNREDVEAVEVAQQIAPMAMSRMYRREFLIMSVAFGLNHATVTTPIIYASSVLTNSAGQGSNAMLYIATLIVSLLFSNPLFSLLGSKKGLSISMVLYAVYVFLFAFAANECMERDAKGKCVTGSGTQLPAAVVGAMIGGCGAGLLWTCQGAVFASSAQRLAEVELKDRAETTAELAGTFGVIFLGFEAGVRALTTLLHVYAKMNYSIVFYLYSALALASAVAFMASATELQNGANAPKADFCTKILAAVKMWRDPKMWLLQSTNITFGFAAAWLGGYVGENILSQALSSGFIGFAGAMLSALAAVLSRVLGRVSQKTGKGPILLLGAACFALLGALSKCGDPARWHWGVLVFYACMGVGRAVYESTNKAIFADFFPGPEQGPGVFANVFVFSTGASAAAFLLGALDKTEVELYILLLFAALTFPGFLLASAVAKRAEARELQGATLRVAA